eukprot:TRINITY_DN3520_c0_g1_i13.p1 TRINITY_DN3520_c0_g1~~TRINITY_DN3520_c0_g1_i13.p1  ORF type:complete len:748 (-),score=180.01 TRINITY_DN3520_c0_g1_i13:240-2483(-)
MTGSGKTHTMLGDIYGTATNEKGISSLAIDSLFRIARTTAAFIKISYLEIYNEQVKDLLNDSCSDLMIVEDPVKGVVVPELTQHVVTNSDQILNLILKGNEKRIMAATSVNRFSSRSHAILQITLEVAKEQTTMAKLSLVDLAGSECSGKTETSGIRKIETGKINKSLLALGTCIKILTGKKSGAFVPYRDSKLTRLLKDSLGGNAKTIMIACVSPYYYEETVNTLNYAERAKKIKNKVCRHIKEREPDIEKYKKIIESLKSEIAELKEKLQVKNNEDLYFHPLSITKSDVLAVRKCETLSIRTPSLLKPPMLTKEKMDARSNSCEKELVGRSRERRLEHKTFNTKAHSRRAGKCKSQFTSYESIKQPQVLDAKSPVNDFERELNDLIQSQMGTTEKRSDEESLKDNKSGEVSEVFQEGACGEVNSFEVMNGKSEDSSTSNDVETMNAKKLLLSDIELEDTKLQLKEVRRKLKASEEEAKRQTQKLKEMAKYKELYNDIIKAFPSHTKSPILSDHNISKHNITPNTSEAVIAKSTVPSVAYSKVNEIKVVSRVTYNSRGTRESYMRKRKLKSGSAYGSMGRTVGSENSESDISRRAEAIQNFIEAEVKSVKLPSESESKPALTESIIIPDISNIATRNVVPQLTFANDFKSPKEKNQPAKENDAINTLSITPVQAAEPMKPLHDSIKEDKKIQLDNAELKSSPRKHLSTSTIEIRIPRHKRRHTQHLEASKIEFERVSISINPKVVV